MKALSIRQPWAWAILNAGKRIENRERADGRMPDICRHRGPLLLHASKTCTRREYDAAADWMLSGRLARIWALGPPSSLPVMPPLAQLGRGGIVGVCEAIGHVTPDGQTYAEPRMNRVDVFPGLDLRWHDRRQFGLVLARVRPLPFTPYKGAPGLFDVPESIVGPLLIEAP